MEQRTQDTYIEELGKTNTDWYDELFRNSVSTTHNLSINGGGDKYTYYTSLAYTRNAGLLKIMITTVITWQLIYQCTPARK